MILSHSELEKASNIGNRLTSLVNKKRFNFDGRLLITHLQSEPLHIQNMGIIFMIFIKRHKKY